MIVKLYDGTEFPVSQSRGEEIAKAWTQSKDGVALLGGGYVDLRAIKSILPGGYTEPDVYRPNDPRKRLKSDYRSNDEKHQAERRASEKVRKELEDKGILPKRKKPP